MLKLAVIILSVCYPFGVYWGLQHYEAKLILPLLLVFLGIRWIAIGNRSERYVVIVTLLLVVFIAVFYGEQLGLKFYPVMMNLGFLFLFVGSLFSSASFVERLARLSEPDLPPKAVIYTRKVTWVWSVFFLVNGSVAAATALWATNEIWLLYNGLIAYLMMGLLAGGEWLVRQRVRNV